MHLAGRRALVTGAAGGLGRAIAHALHRRGATVVLSGRNRAGLEALAGELGTRAEVLIADLSDVSDVERLAAESGPVDVLVANAALPTSGRYDSFTTEELERAVDVNLTAPMQLTRALAPAMEERGAGHIVFISSLNGKVATSNASVYAAAKFGMRGFSFGLRQDLRGTGVGVTCVFPGFISEAGMWADGGLELPAFVRQRSPGQVATAVIKGIERDRAEIDVAPFSVRIGGLVSGFAPNAVATVTRRFGGDELSAALAEKQRSQR